MLHAFIKSTLPNAYSFYDVCLLFLLLQNHLILPNFCMVLPSLCYDVMMSSGIVPFLHSRSTPLALSLSLPLHSSVSFSISIPIYQYISLFFECIHWSAIPIDVPYFIFCLQSLCDVITTIVLANWSARVYKSSWIQLWWWWL